MIFNLIVCKGKKQKAIECNTHCVIELHDTRITSKGLYIIAGPTFDYVNLFIEANILYDVG